MALVIDSAPLTVDVITDGCRPSIVVRGRADFSNVSDVVNVVDRLADESECCISLDLAGVDSMDTAALEGFAGSATAMKRQGKRLHLGSASQTVQNLIDRLSLSDLFCGESECTCGNAPHACRIAAKAWEIDVFSLPSSMECCQEARVRVGRVADAVDFARSGRSDVMLAVGEAVANAVTHGGRADGEGFVTVSCIATSEKLCVTVTDNGPGFSPEDVPSMEEALMMEHGRGIHCMRAVMDEVSFHFDSGTTVRMVKSGV